MAASTNDSMIAGPAWLAAAWPVMTKMPPPITAPMPRAVSPQGPRWRRRLRPLASSWAACGCLVAHSCLNMCGGLVEARRQGRAGKTDGPARGRPVGGSGRLGQLAVADAVAQVDQQAEQRPANEQVPVHHERLPE